jgi:integrase
MKFTREFDLVALNSIVETLQDSREKLIFQILKETSCKVSELASIKTKDISKNSIKIKNRTVPISQNLYKTIQNQKINEEFLFTTRQSSKISTKRIRQIVQSTSKEILGFSISPEQIRKLSIKQKLKTRSLQKVKSQVGLKRLDKRKYLTQEQVKSLREKITSKRDALLVELLLHGLKSTQIANLKVEDLITLDIPSSLTEKIENYFLKNKVSYGEYIFKTRQNSHLTRERIFQIIKSLGKQAGIKVSPQILNNTALANAFSSNNSDKLNALGVKTRAFHLHASFLKDE